MLDKKIILTLDLEFFESLATCGTDDANAFPTDQLQLGNI